MALSSSNETISLAGNVHSLKRGSVVRPPTLFATPMNQGFQVRFTAVLLVLVTAAAITLAGVSFRKGSQYAAPYDGIWWVEHGQELVADRVDGSGPGARAGIRVGDRVLAVDGR